MIIKNCIWTWKTAILMSFCLSNLTPLLEILLELNCRRSGTLDVPQIAHDLCKSILLSQKRNSNTHFIAFLLQYEKQL